jgi:hypothetical protein
MCGFLLHRRVGRAFVAFAVAVGVDGGHLAPEAFEGAQRSFGGEVLHRDRDARDRADVDDRRHPAMGDASFRNRRRLGSCSHGVGNGRARRDLRPRGRRGRRRERGVVRRPGGMTPVGPPQDVHQNQLNNNDGSPEQTLPVHCPSPVGEGRNEALAKSAGYSTTGTRRSIRDERGVISGPYVSSYGVMFGRCVPCKSPYDRLLEFWPGAGRGAKCKPKSPPRKNSGHSSTSMETDESFHQRRASRGYGREPQATMARRCQRGWHGWGRWS